MATVIDIDVVAATATARYNVTDIGAASTPGLFSKEVYNAAVNGGVVRVSRDASLVEGKQLGSSQ